MKKSSIIIIAIVLAVAIVVGLLAVWIVGVPQITGGKKILIEDASLDWEYDMYFNGYVLKKVTVRFKNVGDTEVSGFDLYIRGQANWHVESGYSDTFMISGGIERLKPGETRTVSGGEGVVIKQSGTYTLTLQVIGGYPTATEVLGESTMTIQVP